MNIEQIIAFLLANFGDVAATAVTALAYWVGSHFVTFAKAWVDQKNLATLEKALLTGLTNALSQGMTGQAAVNASIAYSKSSTPGAIGGLKATETILQQKAGAMLTTLAPQILGALIPK